MSVSTTQTAESRGNSLAVLGVGFCVAVTIGNAIGAGILRTPGVVAAHFQTFWPFIAVWAIGGIYALLGANALAELATLMPRSGGQYVFVRKGIGNYAGFVVGWSDWLLTCGATAAVAMVVGEYAIGVFPEARTHQVIALAVVAVFTLVQWAGVRAGAGLQTFTTAVKALALLLFVALCFWLGTRSPVAATALTTERDGSVLIAFVLALQAVIYTYDGWSAAAYFSGEVRDYAKSIPRAMLSAVGATIALYIMVNVSLLAVASLPTIAGSDFAAAVAVERLVSGGGETVVRLLVILVLLSAVSSKVLIAPRVLFAMANDGLFWRGAREINLGGTPDVALLISSVLTAAFIVTGTFETIIAKLVFFFVANNALSFIALFILRRREPDAPRPYRAWGHPTSTAVALVASIVFLGVTIAVDLRSSVHAVALLLLSAPLYLAVSKRRNGATDEPA